MLFRSTLYLADGGPFTTAPHLTKVGYHYLNSFTHIGHVCGNGSVLAVHPSSPFKSVADVVAAARKEPDKWSYGTSGMAGPHHLSGELFKSYTGVNLVHVPYKGGAPAVADLIAGHVQIVFAPVSEAIQQIKAGKLRALAVTTKARLDVFPDIPTVGDFVPGYEASGFAGIGVPKATPAEIVTLLNKELNTAVADARIRARIVELGGTPLGGTPAEFATIISEATDKWAKVIKFAGVKAE